MKLASDKHKSNNDAWLSLVERCVRDAEAAGSNPVASIQKTDTERYPFFVSLRLVEEAERRTRVQKSKVQICLNLHFLEYRLDIFLCPFKSRSGCISIFRSVNLSDFIQPFFP